MLCQALPLGKLRSKLPMASFEFIGLGHAVSQRGTVTSFATTSRIAMFSLECIASLHVRAHVNESKNHMVC